ncbi:MAG: hypothetical protein K8L97_25965 [Anaerolineae bacterium]|nr:hypothetical protein [Anaerolineae bacterium]
MRRVWLAIYNFTYRWLACPLIFRQSPQNAHETAMRLLGWLDDHFWTQPILRLVHRMSFRPQPVEVGGVSLPHPLILAAGFVKGHGFDNEDVAFNSFDNIIPGWRAMPDLVGAVEFGSFTRWPRMGNPGTVIWRDVPTNSTQNYIGLKNPGSTAAAYFLGARKRHLPSVFGINIAVSPGVSDADQERTEVLETISSFLAARINPSWFTLNISCPNTEDDPGSHQTESRTHALCSAVVGLLGESIPLWVKISPNLSDEQYRTLMRVFAETGVRAVIATNTLPAPQPDNPALQAGVGGGRLHPSALRVAALLMVEKTQYNYPVDVIGCGGLQDGETFLAYADLGIRAAQYWSALIYRGPLAGAVIAAEAAKRLEYV